MSNLNLEEGWVRFWESKVVRDFGFTGWEILCVLDKFGLLMFVPGILDIGYYCLMSVLKKNSVFFVV